MHLSIDKRSFGARAVRALAWTAVAGALASAPARGQESELWDVGVGVNFTYDDNLLRLPNGISPTLVGVPTDSRSAFVTNPFLRLVADVPFSRQRFRADFTLDDYRYSSGYSYLNFTGWAGSADWIYQFGNYWSGNAYYQRINQLAGFADFRNFDTQNIQTVDSFGVNTDYWLVRNWRLSGGANYTKSDNSATSASFSNLDQWWFEGGLKYESSAANFARVTGRYTHGEYPDRPVASPLFDTEYDQYDIALDGNWQFTAALRAYGRIAYTNRRFPNSDVRSFSGPTWRFQVDWAITVKTGVNFTFRREIGATTDITATYILTQGPRIAPYWEITPKLRLDAYYEYLSRDYQGDPLVITNLPPIEDRYNLAGIGLTWQPDRHWLLSAGYRYSERHSNYPTRQFDDNTLYTTVQFLF